MKKYKYFTFVIIFVLIGIIYQLYHVKQFNFGQGDFDIAIMLETETGKYKKTKLSQWPSEDEYIFNSDKSYCLNDSPLIWNNGNLTVNTKGSDRCFIYFKKLQSVSNEISKRILEFNGGKSSIKLKPEPDFSTRATTNEGMFATNDEYGTSYYFRGAVDNNWVYFGGHYWRIVRINGDGSIRLIYSGSEEPTSSEAVVMLGTKTGIGSSVINSTATGAEYAGYMYTPGQERGFNNNSAVKTFIDNWYNNNLKEYEEHIADSTFCNDKSLYTNINGTGPIKGVGLPSSGWWYFGASTRLISEKSPNLICTNKLDSFTVSDSTHGNAKLTNPIGMISADETVFAGGNFQINNADYYLYVGQFFWTMSPAHVEVAKVRYLLRGNAWGVSSDRLADVASVVRPVINLKSDLEMEGTGKYNDPYRLVPITLAKKILANNGGKLTIESKSHDFDKVSPVVLSYSEITSMYSTIMGSNNNKHIGEGYTLNQRNGQYSLTNSVGNQSYSQDSVGKYTCDGAHYLGCKAIYKINEVTGTNITNSTRYTSRANLDPNETGMYALADDYGTSYYFRGAVDNNWVLYAGFYWRVVRINGDSSIKLIYTGAQAPSYDEENEVDERVVMTGDKTQLSAINSFNSNGDRAEYIGYMYKLNQHRGHENDSSIKIYLDTWYEENLLNHEESLSDFIVCNDRGFKNEWTPVGLPSSEEGTQMSNVNTRLNETEVPQLTCSNKEDAYTVNDTEYGNGKLTYKIGLLTADEVTLAGGYSVLSNNLYYLNTGKEYWLVSPFAVGTSLASGYFVISNGQVYSLFSNVTQSYGVRPVISLKPDVLYSGSGLWNDPYVIST